MAKWKISGKKKAKVSKYIEKLTRKDFPIKAIRQAGKIVGWESTIKCTEPPHAQAGIAYECLN